MGRKSKTSKTKTLSDFHSKFPSEFGRFKAGDEVAYKRMSDDAISIGILKYFHTKSKRPSATLIDLVLGSFQTAFIEDLDLDITASKKRAIFQKIVNKNSKVLEKKK